MEFLRRQLDDPEAEPCGRCDNCGGLVLAADLSSDSVAAARERLARPGVAIEPRKQWPTGLDRLGLPLKGRIREPAAQGRVVARLTDLGHGQALRDLFRDGTADGPVPPGLVDAVMQVMKDWSGDWPGRPELVVAVESATRPTLVRDLADGLARTMRVPLAGHYALVDPTVLPGQGAHNSAQRIAAVHRRSALRIDPEYPVAGRSVLLVDDLVVTGWTLTLASAALREAGAAEVLPFALATRA